MKNREIRMQFEKYLETIGTTHKTFISQDNGGPRINIYISGALFILSLSIHGNLYSILIQYESILNVKRAPNMPIYICIRKHNTNGVGMSHHIDNVMLT